ncbi:MAG TPA: tRNA 4-thiouridine(8) synthase ThiI, partial [Planctomycetes bacterium]|nr:tRNA 4-thiouridine(8) synthase ThiI [Planctomycetota bacterium]
LRPLVTFDKQETVDLARRIGTFDISARPFPDCCTVFTPSRPVIRGKIETALEEEEKLPWKELLEECFRGREEKDFPPTGASYTH